jgi:UDP-N-acetylmuramate dehydrogenase
MLIQENIKLAEYTTFKIGGPARFFCAVSNEDQLIEAVGFAKKKKLPIFVLGGGSNVLVSDKGFQGLVIKMEIAGIEEHDSLISVGAGELWDDFVDWAVERGFYGIENLSAIPGTVGAAPVQNIGAYGAEAAQVISSVRALDTKSMKFVELSNAECSFAYRDTLFKHERGRYVITRVDFSLSKNGKANIDYKDLKDYFMRQNQKEQSEISSRKGSTGKGRFSQLKREEKDKVGGASPTLRQVREAVIDVRWKKLPDWKLWGTAGSFFKNPIVGADRFKAMKERYPDLPGFPEPDGRVKVSLGWILDKVCDVKGLKMGKSQVYEKQALVLVAMPGASAAEVVGLSQELMKRVKDKTGLDIEGEVEWVN